ncbi:MAG: hypothetical protein AAFY98_05840, partial [Verrucomicrobiota bacterium]
YTVDLKRLFCEKWKTSTGHDAQIAKGQTKLFTSEHNFEYIADVALAKAIISYPLYNALHAYKSVAEDLVQKHKIPNYKDEFKDRRTSAPGSWGAWEGAIDQEASFSDEDKSRLKEFLCDSEAAGGIKGIARGDFASPAITKSIGHRIDRFGIAEEIAAVVNQDIYDRTVSALTRTPGSNSSVDPNSLVPFEKLLPVFSSACDSTGLISTSMDPEP